MKLPNIGLLTVSLVMLCTIHAANAQTFEIRAVNKGNGIIGIQLRTTATPLPVAANYITDIVFGIKWVSTYNVDLSNSITTTYNIKKAGVRGVKGSYHFQAFYADNTPFLLPASWTLNNWVEIMSVVNTRQGLGTGMFEICETGFDVTTDLNVGLDLIDKSVAINGSASGVTLPVNWLHFGISTNKASVKLDWSTALEQNNKGFEIQRSTDAANGFAVIGWVDAGVNTTGTFQYAFVDSSALPNVRYYYRLKQLDKDGNFNYSEIRTALLKELNAKGIRIAPNPVTDVLNIFIDKNVSASQASIVLIDSKGMKVNSQNVPSLLPGDNYKIDISSYSSGIYCVVVKNAGGVLQYNQILKK